MSCGTSHNTTMCYAYVLALTARKKDSISILDWGGYSYLTIKEILPGVQIDYYCKETSVMCGPH